MPRRKVSHALLTACGAVALLAPVPIPASGASLGGNGLWHEYVPPPPRALHSLVYDQARRRLIVFGGAGELVQLSADVWALDLASGLWSPIRIGGPAPTPRRDHAFVYDGTSDAIVLFGGWDGCSFLNDAWMLPLTGGRGWTRLEPEGEAPSPRAEQAAAYDSRRNRLLVVGGSDGTAALNDVWALSLEPVPRWSRLVVEGAVPAPRHSHSVAYDETSDQLVMMGGWSTQLENDVWLLTLVSPPRWTQAVAGGTPPSPRKDHVAVFDPVRHRLIVFGGVSDQRMNDTFMLKLRQPYRWEAPTPSGGLPDVRQDAGAAYDPAADRLLLFGGWNGRALWDTWSLTLSPSLSWEQLLPRVLPALRKRQSAVLDEVGDRLIVYGGSSTNDTWIVSVLPTHVARAERA